MAENQNQQQGLNPGAALDVEAFNDQNARAKSALNPLFLLAIAAYPLAIGFTTAVRTGKLSLVSGIPTAPVIARSPLLLKHGCPPPPPGPPPPPPPSGPDRWDTSDVHSLFMTGFSFLAVLVTHLILLAYILMKRPKGAPEMKKAYAVAAPIGMFLITVTYFINYLGLTRYKVSPVEWIIFAFFSTALALMSTFLFVYPVRQSNLVRVSED